MSNVLEMKFDPATIEHLGVQMYYTLPPVIAELVSNSYDADAKKVDVRLSDIGEKSIVISDNGHGMTFLDINDKFLMIGRNRRKNENKELVIQKTESGNRNAIGKKGLGKLSFFGIAKTVTIETIRDNKKNVFSLDWDILLKSGNLYKPEIIQRDIQTDDSPGTKIILSNINRSSAFDSYNIAHNLAKTFSIFNEPDFDVFIHHNSNGPIEVKNELRYDNISSEFEWDFPLSADVIDLKYENSSKIQGKIISALDPVSSAMKGISLFSRGKLVNDHEFYDEKASSFGYAYITGFLDVSFIDDWKKDVIATNRKSLNWEDEDANKLRLYLTEIVKYVYKEQRKRKKESQLKVVQKIAGINLEEWQKGLPSHERKLSKKMTDAILSSEGIPTEKQAELIKFVKDSFQFEAFKEFANELEDIDYIDTESILRLLKEWDFIEKREMYKLALGRVETISKFEKLIDENALEVKEIHPFFEKFPWVLDPRINMFKREVTYSQILKERYPESELDEKNRRIDFLCTSVSNHKFIIELKRPKHELKLKDINQAKDYRSFLEESIGTTQQSPNKVIAYIIGGKIDFNDRQMRDEIDTMSNSDKVYVKTFNELLNDAKNYHHEFIEQFEALNTK